MYIKQVIQTTDGEVEYQANLREEEVSFLLEYAINILMRQGALPFVAERADANIVVQSMKAQ